MNSRPIAIAVYALVLSLLGIAGGAVLLDARAQYNRQKQIEFENRQKLADAQARLGEQERILQRLKTDPEYVERAVRARLKYAKPGEVIFRFPD